MSVGGIDRDIKLFYGLLVEYLKPVFSPQSDELNVLHIGLNIRNEDVSVNKFLGEHYSRNTCRWAGDVFTSILNLDPIPYADLRANNALFGSKGDATNESTYQELEALNGRKDYDLIIIRAVAPVNLNRTLQMYNRAISHLRPEGCLFSTNGLKDENHFFEELVNGLDYSPEIYADNPLCEEKYITDCKIAVWKNSG